MRIYCELGPGKPRKRQTRGDFERKNERGKVEEVANHPRDTEKLLLFPPMFFHGKTLCRILLHSTIFSSRPFAFYRRKGANSTSRDIKIPSKSFAILENGPIYIRRNPAHKKSDKTLFFAFHQENIQNKSVDWNIERPYQNLSIKKVKDRQPLTELIIQWTSSRFLSLLTTIARNTTHLFANCL